MGVFFWGGSGGQEAAPLDPHRGLRPRAPGPAVPRPVGVYPSDGDQRLSSGSATVRAKGHRVWPWVVKRVSRDG
ncbi:hypothetical protein GCM10027168_29130 [Streptomyces capparidis]